jgi:hypothetical protein
VVAITTRPSGSQVRQTDVHAKYSGSVLFRNQFKGELPAAEYPKIAVGWHIFL